MYDVAQRLDPDGVFAVSRLAFLEMAEAGFTHVGEFHYLHHGPGGVPYADPDALARQVIRAARSVGLSITLLRVLYGRNGAGSPLGEHQLRFRDNAPDDALRAVERLSAIDDPGVSIGLAPHSVRAVPAEWLHELASFGGAIHAHVAEQPAELESCRAEHGVDPLEVFERAGLLHERFTAVHLTHPAPADPVRLRATDSHAAIDPWLEVRSLELHARGLAQQRNVMSPPQDRHGLARRLLAIGSEGGARSLCVAGGRLGVGEPASMVALDLDRPAALGVPPLEAAALVATPEWVSHSWSLGQAVVVGGEHPLRREVMRAAQPYLTPV
jgi:formimidoylglutamate deiminase